MLGRRSCKSNLGTCVLLRSRDPYRLAAERPTFPARIAFWDSATSVSDAATRAGMNGSRGNWRSVELLRRPTSLHLTFTPSSGASGLSLLIACRSASQFRAPNSFNELDRAFFNGKINVCYDGTLEKEAVPSLANRISTAVGALRTVGTTFRAAISLFARTRITAMRFVLNEKFAI